MKILSIFNTRIKKQRTIKPRVCFYSTKNLAIFILPILLLFSCRPTQPEKQGNFKEEGVLLPRALFITTGTGDGRGTVAQGVVLAIQELNKYGIPVRLETRDILSKRDLLFSYNMLILSTAVYYHDADRQYSLTYLSDDELENISEFVALGGVLIAGDNVGRNYLDGTDRITVFGKLDKSNWPLAGCLGVNLSERNLQTYHIEATYPELKEAFLQNPVEKEIWALVAELPENASTDVLAWWNNGTDSFPAFTRNSYQEGVAYLLPSSYYLHPSNDGGFWSASQIADFYKNVVEYYFQKKHLPLHLNPWPDGFSYAFNLTFNAEGNKEQFNRVIGFLEKNEMKATWFVNGILENDLKNLLLQSGQPLASNGYIKKDFSDDAYSLAVQRILFNEQKWAMSFSGFRFPYTRPGFWGLFALKENNYHFESSIGADNLNFYNGSVVPYNLPISNNDYYSCCNLIEIAPCYYDDYNFIGKITESNSKDKKEIEKQYKLYLQYLLNYWNYGVKPYQGQMTFLGHPAYTGYSDSSLMVLQQLVDTVLTDNVWFCTMAEMAEFKRKIQHFTFYFKGSENNGAITMEAPADEVIEKLSFIMPDKPHNIRARFGDVSVKKSENGYLIICSGQKGQKIDFSF